MSVNLLASVNVIWLAVVSKVVGALHVVPVLPIRARGLVWETLVAMVALVKIHLIVAVRGRLHLRRHRHPHPVALLTLLLTHPLL